MLCLTLSVFFNSILLRIERGVGVKGERERERRDGGVYGCSVSLCLSSSILFY